MSKENLIKAEKLLKEVIEAKGAFSRDVLTHAENIIKNMQKLAKSALFFVQEAMKEIK